MEYFGIYFDYIFLSCDVFFVFGVKEMIGGKGVDVVLNLFVGMLLQVSFNCFVLFG